tara:strand:+ start:193 stop:561 length:369 start_codon:yes stop_codon:yes gene_type:complete
MATEIDIEQSTQIAALTKDIELLRAEVAKYKDKEHQQFNNRINKLEKWVWGCSAVITAVVTIGGIIPKFVNVGGGIEEIKWVAEDNRKFLDEVVIPSFLKSGWESQFFKSWDKKGRWNQYNY